MYSHSYRDTEFKLLRQVEDFTGQVGDGLTILRYIGGHEKGVDHPPKRIFSMYSYCFRDTKLKLLRQVKDFTGQVVEGLTILRYIGGYEKRVNHTPQTYIQHVFAQLSRYEVQTSQTGRGLHGTCRGGVDDSEVHRGSRKRG